MDRSMWNRRKGRRVVPLLVVLCALLAACGDSPTPTVSTAPPLVGVVAPTTTAAQTVSVDEIGFQFSPATLTIPAGTTIVWTNKEAAKHTVTADDGSFDSGSMEKGATFSRTFTTPGTIGYFCKFHGSAGKGMAAQIVVAAAQGAAPTTAAQVAAVATRAVATAVAPSAAAVVPTTTAPDTSMTNMPGMTSGTPAAATTTTAPTVATLNFRDDVQLTDQAILNIPALAAAPAGRAYFGWLVNSTNNAAVGMGQLTPDANGSVSLRFRAPQNANLLATYDTVLVTTETLDPTPSLPSSSVAYRGQLPSKALIHIRHLLVSFPDTPEKIGLEVGMRGQLQILRRHAEFLHDAEVGKDFAAVKLHAEHIVNLIEGTEGANYGDLNKDGQISNPGDGFGLIKNGTHVGYLDGSKTHAALAAAAPDATADIKLHAGHVGITVDTVSSWMTTIRDRALAITKASDIGSTTGAANEVLVLANQALNGVDLKGDGLILPIPGSGGGLTSYQHAQLMAAISISLGGTPVASQTAPTIASTAPATQAAPAAGDVQIAISNFAFGKGSITIKAGTKVTWTNQDSAPHTATADNGSWDSGTLQKGQSFSFTFNKPGLVKYYCAFHGGPGGQGMSGTITVVP